MMSDNLPFKPKKEDTPGIGNIEFTILLDEDMSADINKLKEELFPEDVYWDKDITADQ